MDQEILFNMQDFKRTFNKLQYRVNNLQARTDKYKVMGKHTLFDIKWITESAVQNHYFRYLISEVLHFFYIEPVEENKLQFKFVIKTPSKLMAGLVGRALPVHWLGY